MGYDTHFHGALEFTRDLSAGELRWINAILNARHAESTEISDAIWQRAKDEQAARGKGPTTIHGPEAAQLAAGMKELITGEGLSADCASSLRISDDFAGLVYCSEKTYDMIAGVNSIIVNARTQIPDFGLKGELLADTEFAPGTWLVEIGSDGLARQREISREQFFEKRHLLYPEGYEGFGQVDPEQDQRNDEPLPYTYEDLVIRAGNDQRGMFYADARPGMRAPVEIRVEQYWPGSETAMDMTLEEARSVGRWLCRKADEISPQRGIRAWLVRKLEL